MVVISNCIGAFHSSEEPKYILNMIVIVVEPAITQTPFPSTPPLLAKESRSQVFFPLLFIRVLCHLQKIR